MRKLAMCMGKVIVVCGMIALCCIIFWACAKEERPQKTGEISYTAVASEELPGELLKMIEERKAEEFRLSFTDEDAMYLVVGYGQQETGGYSIQIKDCYLAEEMIYLDTELVGPLPQESESAKAPSATPWIAIKMEPSERTIYFD